MASTRSGRSQRAEAEEATPAPIVVGLDDSEAGGDALELARVLCEVRGARRIVATVDETPLFFGGRATARKLAEIAAREGAATLVVGAPHRRSSAGRTVLGSVAEHLLHHCPCEVAIAPRGYGDGSLAHAGLDLVSVGFDATAESWNALRHGEALAEQAGAALQVLVVRDPLVTGLEAECYPDGRTSGNEVLELALNTVRDSLRASGRVVEPALRETTPKVAAALAAACEGEILVCGSRPAAERIFLTSVTKRVIEASIRPVLIVPAFVERR